MLQRRAATLYHQSATLYHQSATLYHRGRDAVSPENAMLYHRGRDAVSPENATLSHWGRDAISRGARRYPDDSSQTGKLPLALDVSLMRPPAIISSRSRSRMARCYITASAT